MNRDTVILVVDDDDGVRELAVHALEDQGYTILAAASGSDALEILKRDRRIDLLFTDVVMPRMNGFTLAMTAKRLRPDLKILYASGYVNMTEASNLGAHHGPLLSKPYRPSQLAAEIERVLSKAH